HTMLSGDWSSYVCSSDLTLLETPPETPLEIPVCGAPCAARGAALRGKVHAAMVMTSARQHDTTINEPINFLRDIRTSFSIRETRSTSWRSARNGGAGMAAIGARALVNSRRASR